MKTNTKFIFDSDDVIIILLIHLYEKIRRCA